LITVEATQGKEKGKVTTTNKQRHCHPVAMELSIDHIAVQTPTSQRPVCKELSVGCGSLMRWISHQQRNSLLHIGYRVFQKSEPPPNNQ